MLAYPLDEALKRARLAGIEPTIKPIAPPRESPDLAKGTWRVARVRETPPEWVVVEEFEAKEVN